MSATTKYNLFWECLYTFVNKREIVLVTANKVKLIQAIGSN